MEFLDIVFTALLGYALYNGLKNGLFVYTSCIKTSQASDSSLLGRFLFCNQISSVDILNLLSSSITLASPFMHSLQCEEGAKVSQLATTMTERES